MPSPRGYSKNSSGWAARGDASGLLFVHVLDQFASHFRKGALHVGASDQDRKVTHVDLVLLLKVDVQKRARHQALAERWPGPVDLAFHHLQERLTKACYVHVGPFRFERQAHRNIRLLGHATVAERRDVPQASARNYVAGTDALRDRDGRRPDADTTDRVAPAVGKAAVRVTRTTGDFTLRCGGCRALAAGLVAPIGEPRQSTLQSPAPLHVAAQRPVSLQSISH